MGTLQDEITVVTGASRGLGRAIAERLAREGALVVINYAGNQSAAEETLRWENKAYLSPHML